MTARGSWVMTTLKTYQHDCISFPFIYGPGLALDLQRGVKPG